MKRRHTATGLKGLRPRLIEFDSRRLKPAPKVADRFYDTKEWRRLMREIYEERGRRCEDPQCDRPQGPFKVLYGDHIVELQDGGAALDKSNVLLRCPSCHTRKTLSERARRLGAAPDA